jgi:TetR/AcrR family transcriptional regulator, lmrAB and yxaGH operons repressor
VTNTRERMIRAAIDALRRSGVAGMSFTQILADSGAARGAIYHHFPGGKRQLVAEAAAYNAEDVRVQLALLPTASPSGVVESFLTMIRPVLAAGVEGSSCAVAACAMDADGDSGDEDGSLQRIADNAFGTWTDALAERLVIAGLRPQDSDDLAITLISLLQGAHVLCRASGSLRPFERAARNVLTLVRNRYPERAADEALSISAD